MAIKVTLPKPFSYLRNQLPTKAGSTTRTLSKFYKCSKCKAKEVEMVVITNKESMTKYKMLVVIVLRFKTPAAMYLSQNIKITNNCLYLSQSLSPLFHLYDLFLLGLMGPMTTFMISQKNYSIHNWSKIINNDNSILKYNI